MNLDMIERMPVAHLIILTLFVYRVTRLITIDEIFEPVRKFVWDKTKSGSHLAYLVTCPWCISLWAALPVVFSYVFFPSMTVLIGCIFALSALAGLITARLDS
jgi:hypothetical protein